MGKFCILNFTQLSQTSLLMMKYCFVKDCKYTSSCENGILHTIKEKWILIVTWKTNATLCFHVYVSLLFKRLVEIKINIEGRLHWLIRQRLYLTIYLRVHVLDWEILKYMIILAHPAKNSLPVKINVKTTELIGPKMFNITPKDKISWFPKKKNFFFTLER